MNYSQYVSPRVGLVREYSRNIRNIAAISRQYGLYLGDNGPFKAKYERIKRDLLANRAGMSEY